MRILFLTSAFAKGFGVGLVIAKQAEELRKRGYEDLIVATPDVTEPFAGPESAKGLRILTVGMDRESVYGMIRETRPDVVVVHTPPFFGPVAEFAELPIIRVAYDHGEPSPYFFSESERSARESINSEKYRSISGYDAHVSISEFIRRSAQVESSTVLYNGTEHLADEAVSDDSVRRELGLADNDFLIVTLSRIGVGESHYKGFEELAEVKRRIERTLGADEQCRFLVMGRSVPPGNPAELKLEAEGFTVISNVTDEWKRRALQQADVFISPSLWEGFNLPLIEAQWEGTPALAFSVGAHPEVCPFHFPTIDEMVHYVVRLRRDPVLRVWCGKVGKDYVRRQFGWEQNVSGFAELLHSLVAGGSKLRMERNGERSALPV